MIEIRGAGKTVQHEGGGHSIVEANTAADLPAMMHGTLNTYTRVLSAFQDAANVIAYLAGIRDPKEASGAPGRREAFVETMARHWVSSHGELAGFTDEETDLQIMGRPHLAVELVPTQTDKQGIHVFGRRPNEIGHMAVPIVTLSDDQYTNLGRPDRVTVLIRAEEKD